MLRISMVIRITKPIWECKYSDGGSDFVANTNDGIKNQHRNGKGKPPFSGGKPINLEAILNDPCPKHIILTRRLLMPGRIVISRGSLGTRIFSSTMVIIMGLLAGQVPVFRILASVLAAQILASGSRKPWWSQSAVWSR